MIHQLQQHAAAVIEAWLVLNVAAVEKGAQMTKEE